MHHYTIVNCTSGRIRSFTATGWAEVEQILAGMGLDPEDWDIVRVEAA
jgi:hypothetical protein